MANMFLTLQILSLRISLVNKSYKGRRVSIIPHKQRSRVRQRDIFTTSLQTCMYVCVYESVCGRGMEGEDERQRQRERKRENDKADVVKH